MLQKAYCMELETVMNYLANSINLDGVRAEEIKKSLAADITEEIGHAQQLGNRIKQLGGQVPGSASVKIGSQQQPPADRGTPAVVGIHPQRLRCVPGGVSSHTPRRVEQDNS